MTNFAGRSRSSSSSTADAVAVAVVVVVVAFIVIPAAVAALYLVALVIPPYIHISIVALIIGIGSTGTPEWIHRRQTTSSN